MVRRVKLEEVERKEQKKEGGKWERTGENEKDEWIEETTRGIE